MISGNGVSELALVLPLRPDSFLFICHARRHTRAIRLLESGELDAIRLKDFLGHCSLSSTLVYRQVTEAVQRANLKLGLR